MSEASQGESPDTKPPTPFVRFIADGGSLLIVRRSAVDVIEPAFHGNEQISSACFITVSGEKHCVAHSPEHVLEMVWDRDGDHAS